MIGYDIFEDLRLVRFHWTGPVSGEALAQVSNDYIGDPRFRPEFDMSMDLRGGWFAERALKNMEDVVEGCVPYYSAHGPDVRSALYAPDQRSYGLARMYASLARLWAHYPIEIFQDPREALAWLGRPDDPATVARVYPDR